MKIFDIHVHIFPDAIAERAVAGITSSCDGYPSRSDGRLDSALRLMDEAGVERFAAHSVATREHQVASINRFILESWHAHPDRIVPFATLHPDTPDLPGAVQRIVDEGFQGIKLHPEIQGFKVDDPRAMELFGAIAGRLPVLLHCGDARRDNSVPARIKNMKRQLPELTLVCAHLGGWTTWERAAAELIGEDIWVDLSSSMYALDPATAERIIRGYGVDRVLFGSDVPMGLPGEEIERFMHLNFTPQERQAIFWDNHVRLLGGE